MCTDNLWTPTVQYGRSQGMSASVVARLALKDFLVAKGLLPADFEIGGNAKPL